ncbi:MAG: hypothetical protein J1F69_00790 [Clostridiales bacterium]|nr:hypothetical protein [Clostridiales bacterium]
MEEHDYKDTLNEIIYAEDNAQSAKEAARRRDAEIAYEALAVSSSMGALGQEDELVGLMQLQLTQEVLYKTQADYNGNKKDD